MLLQSKNQQAETVKNDSITEFFRNFYTGCNEYFVQRDKADRDNKSDSYRLYLNDKFISFLKDFCYDDIVAEAYNYDLDIYERDGIDSLNDSNLQSLHVERWQMKRMLILCIYKWTRYIFKNYIHSPSRMER